MSEGFAGSPDLNDPAQLAAQCRHLAGGMRQQAVAAQGGSALGGNPYPSFFYGSVADTLEAAARMADTHKSPNVPTVPVDPHEAAAAMTHATPVEPPPAPKPATKTKVDKNLI
jgi:hypothetical protein